MDWEEINEKLNWDGLGRNNGEIELGRVGKKLNWYEMGRNSRYY